MFWYLVLTYNQHNIIMGVVILFYNKIVVNATMDIIIILKLN